MDMMVKERPRRVCFYGRVSTEHEAQTNALENQMEWYNELLKRHENWTLTGSYIDKGITGTLAKKRTHFLKMIKDAENGVILSILVDTFISKISFPMQPGPEIGSISDA